MSALTHLALFLLGLAAGLGSPTAHLDRERTIVVTSRPPYYTPAVLRVTVGEAVRWINPLPAERHGVREVEQSTFSFELSPGGEQVVRFTQTGEYVYRCRFHPWMQGRIVVEEASGPSDDVTRR
jgi:plastocyanin